MKTVLYLLLFGSVALAGEGNGTLGTFGGGNYSFHLFDSTLAMRLRDGATLRMGLPRGRPEQLDGSRVIYRSVYSDIDLLVYRDDTDVQYDWIVAPFANPSAIRFSFRGAERIWLDSLGDLVIKTASGEVRHRHPFIYQDIDGARSPVAGGFTISEDGCVGFWVAAYDRTRRLVIDPQIVYRATFPGGGYRFNQGTVHYNLVNTVSALATDRLGNVYITGTSLGSVPLVSAVQSSCTTINCVYVAKLSTDGKTVVYSTLLGQPTVGFLPVGGGYELLPSAIACDADGNVYVTGRTAAAQLPQVNGGQAQSAGRDDVFVVKLDPNGGLKATMLIGGSSDDAGTAIALGADGFLYVAGWTQSNDFPVRVPLFGKPIGNPPGLFALKIDPKALNGDTPALNALLYSSVFTGDTTDAPSAVGADSQGNAYIAYGGSVMRINATGTQATNVPFPAGSRRTSIAGLALDRQGYVYVAGNTFSTDFQTTQGAWITSFPKPTQTPSDAPFLAKLNPNGSGPVYSTYLSSDASESIFGVVVDGAGNAYVSGETFSTQFPGLNTIQSGPVNGFCTEYAFQAAVSIPCSEGPGFVTAVKPDGSGIVWSTLLPNGGGEIAMDLQGDLYVAGSTIIVTAAAPGVYITKISQPGAPIPIDGIVNAASFHPGLPAPGGLATMYVHGLQLSAPVTATGLTWPTELGGLAITVAGIPAPVLSVSNIAGGEQQINFQVPVGAPQDGAIAEVDLIYQGLTSTAVPARVAPGIFTLTDVSAAIQHASDYSLVTPANPAQKGEVVIVYLTGLRQICSASSANLGDILYAGATPGYSGLDQINLRISANAPSGNNQLTMKFPACWGTGPDGIATAPANDTTTNTVTLPVQ